MRYLIEHESRLRFPEPVREHHFELRLAPQSGESLRVLRCEVTVAPETELREHIDCFGNTVHRLSLLAPHEHLRARVRAEVETQLANPFDYAAI
ncbi:MAG TPA: transglutaminase N-terminal domain-containing protein, partial [Myxococcota bacterium]|nr:transglutaminase N-terminal domain-containing protein [Myxococcota bacterium]